MEFSGFINPLNSKRFQSQLGKEIERRYKEGQNVVRLALARVTKVNYKYNTVDVVTTRYKDSFLRNPTDNGRYSARLPIQFGGRTPRGDIYGTNTLVTVGSLVLIGFLEGNKDSPIVLNIYGDADNQSMLTRTTFTSADESDESIQQELWQLFSLYPSMTYRNIDGHGNQEVTFSGKTFLYITDTDQEHAYVNDVYFDYEHLPSSTYANDEPIEPISPYSPTLLYVHQGIYDKHRVTIFIKSDGTFRIGSRHLDEEGITYLELKTDGTLSIVRKRGTIDPEESVEDITKVEVKENVFVEGGLDVDKIINEDYQYPELENGNNPGEDTQEASYWKDKNGVVRLAGTVTNLYGTVTLFTLPEEYRPNKNLTFLCATSSTPCRVDVLHTGEVRAHTRVSSDSPVWVSLSGINYKAKEEDL